MWFGKGFFKYINEKWEIQIDRELCSECLILQNSQTQKNSEPKIFFFFQGVWNKRHSDTGTFLWVLWSLQEHLFCRASGNGSITLLTKSKLKSSFPASQFLIPALSKRFRFERSSNGGGILLFIREDIFCKTWTLDKHLDDMKEIFEEINLRKTIWLLFYGISFN